MQTGNRWETCVLPCPIASCRTDDRFKLLRKKKAAYATGTTNYVTLHKCTLFWGFLGTGVFSKVRMITARKGNSSFKDVGAGGGVPQEVPPSQKVRGIQTLNILLQKKWMTGRKKQKETPEEIPLQDKVGRRESKGCPTRGSGRGGSAGNYDTRIWGKNRNTALVP